MGEKILVTGGTGYIGSHTVVELINEGFEVVIIDDLSNSSVDILDHIEKIVGTRPQFYQFDLCDQARLNDFFKKESDIKGIIHFAASKAVGESVIKPLLYYRNNITSLLNLMDCMQSHQINNLVFSSSCTVYGQPDELPVSERTPFKPAQSPYGNTKQICEEILRDVAQANQQYRLTALRYFNPVGAHPSGLIGELPTGTPNNLVPFITQTVAGLRDSLKVFGTDYDTPDGTAVRDYIHVVDLAKAHVITVKRLLNKKQDQGYEFFNLGTGNGYSVKQVIDAFEKSTGVSVKYTLADRRPGDIERIYANTKFANDVLGWKAELGLEEMMSSAWEWQKRTLS